MSRTCNLLHKFLAGIGHLTFLDEFTEIPLNGIYILFEHGESGHGTDRIVRVGTHTGKDQLTSRLEQHFVKENKDRSIFRKNIGRAFLNKANDSFLEDWELDLTSRKSREADQDRINTAKQRNVEKQISKYIQENFSFVVFQEPNKDRRLDLESKIISSVSWCDECSPSDKWLGLYSPKQKIRESGLWLVNGLYKEPLSEDELHDLSTNVWQG